MAIESMTGFARHETDCADGSRIVCEIRSVNGKSLDLRLRLPSGLERVELQVRQLIQASIGRGNLQVTISVEEAESRQSLNINHAKIEEVLALAVSLHDRYGLAMPTVGELLAVRGVVENAEPNESGDLASSLIDSVNGALSTLKTFRAAEGQALTTLLLGQLAQIEKLTNAAARDESRSAANIRERLRAQVQLLMDSTQGFDEQRLTAEAAILATKADIREELDRLAAHVAAARILLSGHGPAGRKLDFLAQEFNREANTLCSKSNAASVTAIGLELKAVVDQFREQVQNLE